MEINENVNGMNKYDYLKYEFFVIKCYHEKDPIFCICDKITFYYLNCNHNAITIKSLIDSKNSKIEFARYEKTNEPIPVICGIEENSQCNFGDQVYETFASAKINKSKTQKNKYEIAFNDKTVEELPQTFRLISAHTDLQEAIENFINIIEERRKINYKLRDFEIVK